MTQPRRIAFVRDWVLRSYQWRSNYAMSSFTT
jgi:hypothetical protein